VPVAVLPVAAQLAAGLPSAALPSAALPPAVLEVAASAIAVLQAAAQSVAALEAAAPAAVVLPAAALKAAAAMAAAALASAAPPVESVPWQLQDQGIEKVPARSLPLPAAVLLAGLLVPAVTVQQLAVLVVLDPLALSATLAVQPELMSPPVVTEVLLKRKLTS